MAIDAYTGLPGSGKSYSVVKFSILPSLRQGRKVITNIPLTDLAHEEFPGQIVQLPHDWYNNQALFESVPHGSVVVLDELWRRWPKGLPASKVPFRDKEFLAEHRHLVDENGNSTRIVLVTQDLDQLAAFATILVDTTYQSVKLSALGSNKRFRVDIYSGAAKGQRPPKSRLLRQVFDKYEKKIYQYYQSATKSLSGAVGDETKADSRATIWKSPLMIFMLFSPILLVVLGYQMVQFFANGMSFKAPESEVVVEATVLTNPEPDAVPQLSALPQPVALPEPPPPPVVQYSAVWRVAGYIKRRDADTKKMRDAAVLSSLVGVRYVALDECEKISMGFEYQCEIDGSLVTPWSGPINQNMAGYVLGGASQTVNEGKQAVGLSDERSAGAETRAAQQTLVNPI